MKQTDYVVATPADREEVVDFANYVFSQAHRPHDFKTLLPKAYADHLPELGAKHYLAKQEGRIRALVADRMIDMRLLDDTLRVGCVGTVSVHPYSRSEGHMMRLMTMMLEDARAEGLDLLMLGGIRQRYNYFGFEQAGWMYRFGIEEPAVRHALADVDTGNVRFSELTEDNPAEVDFACALAARLPVAGARPRDRFLDIMHSWHSGCRLIRVDGEMAGYVMGGDDEIALLNEDDLPRVIKALFTQDKPDRLSLACGAHETRRIAILADICSHRAMGSAEMINVLNWPRVLAALLKLKAGFLALEDGAFTLAIGDAPSITIRVSGGAPSVAEEGLAPDLSLTHLQAQRKLFGLEAFALGSAYKNWFPLPFSVSPADTF
ncbi:MAG: GNAT family N-acetyltransferase [Clostridia bacterium]|nr:GNAT family N-acetyltransferase [Clostridia bacterium]